MLDWGTPFCMVCGNAFWDGIALLLNTVGGCCTGLAELKIETSIKSINY